MLFTSVAFGQCNNYGFGFTTLNWKPLNACSESKSNRRKNLVVTTQLKQLRKESLNKKIQA